MRQAGNSNSSTLNSLADGSATEAASVDALYLDADGQHAVDVTANPSTNNPGEYVKIFQTVPPMVTHQAMQCCRTFQCLTTVLAAGHPDCRFRSTQRQTADLAALVRTMVVGTGLTMAAWRMPPRRPETIQVST